MDATEACTSSQRMLLCIRGKAKSQVIVIYNLHTSTKAVHDVLLETPLKVFTLLPPFVVTLALSYKSNNITFNPCFCKKSL